MPSLLNKDIHEDHPRMLSGLSNFMFTTTTTLPHIEPKIPMQVPVRWKFVMADWEDRDDKARVFQVVRKLMNSPAKIVTIIYHILNILGAVMFKDWKTTLVGIVGLIAYIVKTLFNIDVPPAVQDGFIAFLLFLIALFAKDSPKKEEGK